MRFFEDLKKYKGHVLYSAVSQLKSEITNRKLSWLWWVLEPLSFMLIYAFVYGTVLNVREEYMPLFIFLGIALFQFFTKTVRTSAGAVRKKKSIIEKVYIPKHMLIIQAMIVNGFKLCVCLILAGVMMGIYRITPTWHLIEMIPVLLILGLFTFGISCFVMHAGVYLLDMSNIIDIAVRMLRYFTGIFYSVFTMFPYPFNIIAAKWNPVALLITASRNILLYHEAVDYTCMIFWGILSVVIASAGAQLIYNNENSYVKVV